MGTITGNETLPASQRPQPVYNHTEDVVVSSTTSDSPAELSYSTSQSSFTQTNSERNYSNSESLDDSVCIVYEHIIPPPDIQIIDHHPSDNPATFRKICRVSSEDPKNLSRNFTVDSTPIDLSVETSSAHEASDILVVNRIYSPREETQASSQSLDTSSSSNRQIKKSSRIECAICMEGPEEIIASERCVVATICGHIFCSLCLEKAFENSKQCPKCRKRLNKKQFHPLYV